MMTMFSRYDGDHAVLVTEEGTTVTVPTALIASAGLHALRTGQRLVLQLDVNGAPAQIRLP